MLALLDLRLAGRLHEQRAVAEGGEEAGIGHRQQRRGVEDHEVVLGEVVDQLLHPQRAQQLARVGRDPAGRQQAQVGHPRLDDDVPDVDVAGEGLGQADGAVDLEGGGDHRTAQVGVDQQHGSAGLGDEAGDVGRDRGLALAGQGRGHHDLAGLVVDVDEPQVGAQLAERLRCLAEVPADASVRAAEDLLLGDDAQHGGAGRLLDVLGGAHPAVDQATRDEEGVGEAQPTGRALHGRALVVGRERRAGELRLLERDDLGEAVAAVDVLGHDDDRVHHRVGEVARLLGRGPDGGDGERVDVGVHRRGEPARDGGRSARRGRARR